MAEALAHPTTRHAGLNGADPQPADPNAQPVGSDSGIFEGQEVTYVVDFCWVPLTTVLNTSHLRNLAYGNALACSLQTGGANVVRQVQVADTGLDLAEAAVEYIARMDGSDPATTGQKSDHFVWRLHRDYLREPRADLVESLLESLARQEPEVVAVCSMIRNWALSGRNETLARLGVRFDRTKVDSELAPLLESVRLWALARGLDQDTDRLIATASMMPVRAASRARVEQDLRELAVWRTMAEEVSRLVPMRLRGQSQSPWLGELFSAMFPDAVQPLVTKVHAESEAPGSSASPPLSLDSLLEMLLQQEELQGLALEERPGCDIGDLATMIVLGACLDRTACEPGDAVAAKVLSGTTGSWTVARAWAKAWRLANDAPSPSLSEEDRRHSKFAQAKLHVLVGGVKQTLEVAPLMVFLERLSAWYLEADADAVLARAMRALLGTGLQSLGLLQPEVARPEAGDGHGR
jgi:hypothetical protein